MEVVNNYSSSGSSGPIAQPASSAPAVKAHANTAAETSTKQEPKQSAVPKQVQDALASMDLPELANGSARVELNFNQDTGRVVAKVTDRVSGDVLRELPSKELQQLFSQMREYLGSFVDEEI